MTGLRLHFGREVSERSSGLQPGPVYLFHVADYASSFRDLYMQCNHKLVHLKSTAAIKG